MKTVKRFKMLELKLTYVVRCQIVSLFLKKLIKSRLINIYPVIVPNLYVLIIKMAGSATIGT